MAFALVLAGPTLAFAQDAGADTGATAWVLTSTASSSS
jgi:hypothetical protein